MLSGKIKYERKGDEFILFDGWKHQTVKLLILFVIVYFIYFTKTSFSSELLFWGIIGVFILFIVQAFVKIIKLIRGEALISINKKEGVIKLGGTITKNIDDLNIILLEEEVDLSMDSVTIYIVLKLEFLDHNAFEICRSENADELKSIAEPLATFLGKDLLEVDNNERLSREDERRFNRMVFRFEEKFKEKSQEELQSILDNKDLMADYTVQAVENLLKSRLS